MFLLHWRRVAVAALRSNRSNPDFAVARYGTNGAIGAILRAVTAEHTLALRAATKAASPRQSLGRSARHVRAI